MGNSRGRVRPSSCPAWVDSSAVTCSAASWPRTWTSRRHPHALLRHRYQWGGAGGVAKGIVCASTAAGPAFEGGRIGAGMRAGTGAIDSVHVRDGGFDCHVIGGGAARGVCGSGLVDAAACGIELGLDRRQRPPRQLGLALCRSTVALTQSDIRELQLAKGAMAAGLRMLAGGGSKSSTSRARSAITSGNPERARHRTAAGRSACGSRGQQRPARRAHAALSPFRSSRAPAKDRRSHTPRRTRGGRRFPIPIRGNDGARTIPPSIKACRLHRVGAGRDDSALSAAHRHADRYRVPPSTGKTGAEPHDLTPPHATYKLLFNGLYYGSVKPAHLLKGPLP